MKVVTRFAPSPTGMLHIGGARTALFCYLFARHHGGEFRLRIEDTDKKRSTEENKQALIDGLKWLEVDWDGEIYYQSQHEARHREVAEELVKRGAAYYDYTSAEELKQLRVGAETKGEFFKFQRAMSHSGPREGMNPSIRIMAPQQGEIMVKDEVQGEVRFGAEVLDDFIILRGDGTPTYMHAVVVDDHDMGVTHIIRGDDHLNNAGRQMIIYKAMGWDVPQFAHVSMIHGAEGGKLSKRKGAAGVMEYAEMGYLPEALRNYLVRLGWSHGDDEIFTDAQAIEWFDKLSDINKAPARLDFAKLNHVNAHYLKQKDWGELIDLVQPYLRPLVEDERHLLKLAMPLLTTRASTLVELAHEAKFLLAAPEEFDEKARAALAQAHEILPAVIAVLESLEPWTEEAIKHAAKAVAEEKGRKMGEVMQPLRAAIVGAMSGPDIPHAMQVLGKTRSLARLKHALAA